MNDGTPSRRELLAGIGTLGLGAAGVVVGADGQVGAGATTGSDDASGNWARAQHHGKRTPQRGDDGDDASEGEPVGEEADGEEADREDPPVVENAPEDPDRRITVDVRVVDGDGKPIEGEPVMLQDRGGTPDARFGRTGPEGRLRFVEGVGPPPCNSQLLVLPARDRRATLGCNDGGKTVEHAFRLDDEGGNEGDDGTEGDDGDGSDADRPPLPTETATVVENAADDPDWNLTVDLRVVDDGGGVANEPVVLQDRGGTPDDRIGYTGPRGWIRFVESVGPPPCNRQTVLLPARDRRLSLGCNDGGTAVEASVDVDGERRAPGGRCSSDRDQRQRRQGGQRGE